MYHMMGSAYQVCGTCKEVRYCSRACRTKDRTYHKLVCQPFLEFKAANPRPSLLHKLALHFPVETTEPKFCWIEFKPQENEHDWDDLFCRDPPADAYLGSSSTKDAEEKVPYERIDISTKLHLRFPDEQKYDLKHTVAAFVRRDWATDWSELNQSLDEMMHGRQQIRGPLLLFSLRGTGDDPTFFDDFQQTDIRVLAKFLSLFQPAPHLVDSFVARA